MMLVARSSPECHLYIALHPCPCGDPGPRPEHRLEAQGPALVAVYEATCPGCGRSRRFEFALDDELPPPAPAFGGAAPSTIICPGQFLAHADRLASAVPADPAGDDARGRLAEAIAALDEVLKAIPAGADAVPADACFSVTGHRLYLAEPDRFRRARLEAVRAAHRQAIAPRR
jgi:hypothetical protein